MIGTDELAKELLKGFDDEVDQPLEYDPKIVTALLRKFPQVRAYYNSEGSDTKELARIAPLLEKILSMPLDYKGKDEVEVEDPIEEENILPKGGFSPDSEGSITK